ncbi:pyridoxal-phosphate-dependent aminotransferase family protein [Pseudooceanicola nanhaiensis]|uniref:pyridoxal-phosphate-dependent aminotransferase family protein n=1 Tax=Pseudooceanicola nanhaiensis TaxID=375761 RepID=UPI001CD1ECC8|nr:aminotransferase class V-fold PLP-dependent enzyme [Pseudooceanicola nanhaiensis]MCA0921294.1 aminotransferase class V-fold PLP-dependent enzyme [Pseudooceanicola nanhaiensis]
MTWSPFPQAPTYPASGFAPLADRVAALMKTANDVVLVQGEAVIALEAAASSLARPGLRALNIVSSPYGAWFGEWLRRGGSDVTDLRATPGKPITVEAVQAAGTGFDLVAVVHAESATGILNPLPEIAAFAKAQGALMVVDAVASFGGHALDVDALGLDVVVTGMQKSPGGQAGLSVAAISPAAWAAMSLPGAAPSALCLQDLKQGWIETGRGALPGMPSGLEFHALEATLDAVEAEGLEALIARHTLAGEAMRAGLEAMGLPLWVPGAQASNLVTGGWLPEGIDAALLCAHPALIETGTAPGVGPGSERILRLNHTGPRARFETVLSVLGALGCALRAAGQAVDLGAGAEAVSATYAAAWTPEARKAAE